MLKSLFLSIVLFLASTFCIISVAFASPLIPQANFLVAQSPVSEEVTTKMPTQKLSQSEDISQETQPVESKQEEKKPVVKATRRTYPQPPNPYDMEAMEKFDQEVYGEEN
ncbi:hypothetical protein [Calothrix rhizosoleniae]|uniref:hypothetical protein n=1 Tax=Calothrix rhizosoleniae TaxID=888997 RepID=UPI000B4976C6|nr:hypothetical protein [Calothrix rhizosoleniae]